MVATAALWGAFSVSAGLGAVLRVMVDGALSRRSPRPLPVGTMAVNFSGAFALGVVNGSAASHHVAFVCGTGLIGAYTTFSTWMFETQRLVEERQERPAVQNIVISVVIGVALAALGIWVGEQL